MVKRQWRSKNRWKYKKILPINEAKQIVRELGIKSCKEYLKLAKEGKLEKYGLPTSPQTFYSGKLTNLKSGFVSYKQAKKILKGKTFKSIEQYKKWVNKSGHALPIAPHVVYKDQGFDNYKNYLNKEEIISFEQTKKLMKKYKIVDRNDYTKFRKKCKYKLPTEPEHYRKWKKEWNGWRDFGYERFVSYDEFKKICIKNKIKTHYEYDELYKKKKLRLPSNPQHTYKKEWEGWRVILNTVEEVIPFSKAKKLIQKLGIKTRKEYIELAKAGKLPKGLPERPDNAYRNSSMKTSRSKYKMRN